MKEKRKLGRTLLSFLLTLAMVVGLMPGMGLTAYAKVYTSAQTYVNNFETNDIISKNTVIYKPYQFTFNIYDTDGTSLLQPYQSGNIVQNAQPGYDTIVFQGDTWSVSVKKLSPQTEVTTVSLDNDSLILTAGGETATLTATVTAKYDDIKEVEWASSNTSVATVNNGVVTPVATGTATITVSSLWDNTKTANCTVVVNKGIPTANAPTGLTATYGQTLADVTLTNPEGNTSGTWAWVDST